MDRRPSAVPRLRHGVGDVGDAFCDGRAAIALGVEDARVHEEHPDLVLLHQLLY